MMSSPIIDSLALWGIEGMSQAQTKALIQHAPALVRTLKECLGIIDAHRRATGGDGDLTAANARAIIQQVEAA